MDAMATVQYCVLRMNELFKRIEMWVCWMKKVARAEQKEKDKKMKIHGQVFPMSGLVWMICLCWIAYTYHTEYMVVCDGLVWHHPWYKRKYTKPSIFRSEIDVSGAHRYSVNVNNITEIIDFFSISLSPIPYWHFLHLFYSNSLPYEIDGWLGKCICSFQCKV